MGASTLRSLVGRHIDLISTSHPTPARSGTLDIHEVAGLVEQLLNEEMQLKTFK